VNWGYFAFVWISSLFITVELRGFTLQWGISLVFQKKATDTVTWMVGSGTN